MATGSDPSASGLAGDGRGDLPDHVIDVAIAAWLYAWNRIGGLTPEQRQHYRAAMRAAFAAARTAESGSLPVGDRPSFSSQAEGGAASLPGAADPATASTRR